MAAVTGTYMGRLEEKTGSSRRIINKHVNHFMNNDKVVKFGRKIFWKPHYQGYEIFSRMPSQLLAKLEKAGVNSFEFACSNIFVFVPNQKGERVEMDLQVCQKDERMFDVMVRYLKEELGFTKRKDW